MQAPYTSATPWWVSAIVIVGALLMAVGAVVAITNPGMLVAPGSQITDAVRTYAGYFISRNLALAILLLVMVGTGSRQMLTGLIALTALIQVFDAILDATEGRWTLVPGVTGFAIAYIIAAMRLSGRAFWRK